MFLKVHFTHNIFIISEIRTENVFISAWQRSSMLTGDNKSNERVSLTVSANNDHMSKRDPNRAAGFNYETPESQQEKRDANEVKRHMIDNEVKYT